MEKYYTSERNSQILIALMKKHGIKKIVASPGATNVCFVGSVQQDDYFEIYSSVDERSAAYIACGLAAESGEPVALSCTGATASRNYTPGLTEAFYRQLPVLAITSTQHMGRVGNHIPQVIDRSVQMNDTVKLSVSIPTIHDDDDEWAYGVMLNKAILELSRNGGGPVHINLVTQYNDDFSVKQLPAVKVIDRFVEGVKLPLISKKSAVAIFVGAHKEWSQELTSVVDSFCERYNGVVLCDTTSNYNGMYKVFPSLIYSQITYLPQCLNCDILIHIGNISGMDNNQKHKAKEVWRVNPDGEVRDSFKNLRYVFEMEEISFFKHYVAQTSEISLMTYFEVWKKEYNMLLRKIPELPFSNAWIAQYLSAIVPSDSIIHYGILNSLRSFTYFEPVNNIRGYANTGGFGIDGCVSSLIGASLVNQEKIYWGVVGDLAFFYDMNSIGNRHIGNNFRLMVVNNGRGQEFRNSLHHAAKFGTDADPFMAAAGHFGNQSHVVLRHYADDLGYEYLNASTKEEFLDEIDVFMSLKKSNKPIIFEVFTDTAEESKAFDLLHNLEISTKGVAKHIVKNILGDTGVKTIKKIIGR